MKAVKNTISKHNQILDVIKNAGGLDPALLEASYKSLIKNDYSAYIVIVEKPYRLNAFLELYGAGFLKDDKEFWELLGQIWGSVDIVKPQVHMWTHLVNLPKSNRQYFMSEKDRETFSQLPEEFTIYRGCDDSNRNGLSWTLSKEKAEFFAHTWIKRDNKKGEVISKIIKKSEAFAYVNEREEQEIVLFK